MVHATQRDCMLLEYSSTPRPLLLMVHSLFSLCGVGDYSSSQMLRVNRQAMVLHKYYELLTDAIDAHREHGCHYMVTTLATRAGKVLGEDTVACSTVRIWHADYVEGSGVLKADERGHYGRELLITEEDIQHKFVKWSLRTAKDSCLSVASARDFLNTDLLRSLEACAQVPAAFANLHPYYTHTDPLMLVHSCRLWTNSKSSNQSVSPPRGGGCAL